MARSAVVLSPLPMEDLNLLAADCLVICSCCPCLILQVLVLLLIRLPCRLARKSKKLVLKRLGKRRRRRKGSSEVPTGVVIVGEEPVGVQMAVADAVLCGGLSCRGCAIVEAERVLQELYKRGELGFRNFWRSGGGGQPVGVLPWHAVVADRLVVRDGSNARGVYVRYV